MGSQLTPSHHTPPRNAQLPHTVAATPHCIKTASVPTSGRSNKVPDLNRDLLGELRGAILDESRLKAEVLANNSITAHLFPDEVIFCAFPRVIALGKVIYTRILGIFKTSAAGSLFQDGCWNSSHIPSIICATSPKQHPRQITLRETGVHGTFIPDAGTEEAQLAHWFNRISDQLCRVLPLLISTNSPRSLVCMRRWSSCSSTMATEGGIVANKPDLALCDQLTLKSNTLRRKPPFEWKDIRVLCELTSKPFNVHLEEILSISNRCLRVHLFDRAGAIFS
ncbi:hypothetical protein BV22DRAFT_1052862, partial [Leucogyrophana mollusca]